MSGSMLCVLEELGAAVRLSEQRMGTIVRFAESVHDEYAAVRRSIHAQAAAIPGILARSLEGGGERSDPRRISDVAGAIHNIAATLRRVGSDQADVARRMAELMSMWQQWLAETHAEIAAVARNAEAKAGASDLDADTAV